MPWLRAAEPARLVVVGADYAPELVGFLESNGAELRRPLGIAIAGGLIVSQLLTLYTTPVVYLYIDRARVAYRRLWHRAGAAPAHGKTAPIA